MAKANGVRLGKLIIPLNPPSKGELVVKKVILALKTYLKNESSPPCANGMAKAKGVRGMNSNPKILKIFVQTMGEFVRKERLNLPTCWFID